MTAAAWTMMLVTEILVTVVTVYFFVKVLRTPPKDEPDSFTQNDAE
ncbi:MAG: hypothetical protein LW601_05060 [Cryomorphaceae bacterium]|mgnify:FL=1|jgi:hypothetical protein|nr:hypothetical protein [Cryomorphaceae bacterium]